MTEHEPSLLDAAIAYAGMGIPVFPCRVRGKQPLTAHGFKDATTHEETIRRWWTEQPCANIGMPTGAVSGLVVIDIDPRNGGDYGWQSLVDAHSEPDTTPESHTGGGGRHVYFIHPGKNIPCSAGTIAAGVDVKADGGYVLLPPSVHPNGTPYVWEWSSDIADVAPAQCPKWLLELIDAAEQPAMPATARESNPIPEGQRNGTLARLAGGMRRYGMSRDELLGALQVVNANRCTPPLPDNEVERIAGSVARYAPDAISVALAENHYAQQFGTPQATPVSVRQLTMECPSLREPVIHGLLRRGETMNVIAAPKAGKSWLVNDLALSVATGRTWLDTFQVERGPVLLLDNELHRETTAQRIPKVAKARRIPEYEYADHIYIQNMRGQLRDVFTLSDYFESLEPGRFKLIILDAFYRFMPRDMDENDNGTMADLYNHIDRYADHLQCCFVLIHHTTKGNQSGKSVTDVGAGAGSQSRATDSHLVLRPHDQDDAMVLDAAVRSWPPVQPRCLRWAFPVWMPAPELDPTMLRSDAGKKKSATSAQSTPQLDAERFVEQYLDDQPQSMARLLERCESDGVSSRKARRLLDLAEEDGLVHRWAIGPRNALGYATVGPPQVEHHSNDNKRAVVLSALTEQPYATTKDIAGQCGVSDRYVRQIRREMESQE